MKSSCVTAVLVLVFGFQEWSFSQEHADKAKCESAQLAVIVEEESQLFENMGPYRRKFTTDSEAAQEYLNQGMVWIQAFNHDEARRSFLKAAELDPKCAWAWWGVAYCEGPNYNDPKPDGNRSRAAWYALQNALARISNASAVDRDLILALKSRYSNPWPADRSGLENNYADAMAAEDAGSQSDHRKLPNIVLILADDLGYGDMSCYNPQSKVTTPHLDGMAAEGIRFTDAHSASTVCTPTRYSLLTGRMAFRTGMAGVFTGAGGPCLIEEGRLTLPRMLKDQGYATACVGKWHIGLTFLDQRGEPIHQNGKEAVLRIDYSRPIPDAPIHRGFDYFFGTACCPTTDWLYAFIEGDRVPVPPRNTIDKSRLPRHAYSHDCRPGIIAPDFDMENVDLVFLDRSRQFLKQHVKERPESPFFLFHSCQAVHLPSFPPERFQGKTGAGPHGDFIYTLDYVVGQLLHTLDELDVAEDTLVIFTSDNGPEVTSVVNMRRDHGHDGARPWRGMKRDQWEGGHRVPLIARWPRRISAGTVTNATICQTDLMATLAALVGARLPNDCAEDSYDMLPFLLGEPGSLREQRYILHQTISLALAIRKGPWKYLDHRGSGGNRYDKGELQQYRLPDTAPDAPGQLYNLESDPGETRNLYFEHPEIVREMKDKLEEFKKLGRSVPPRG